MASLATILTVLIIVLSSMQFLVNHRKDRLADAASKVQQANLNQRVANAEEAATKSLTDLAGAKAEIVRLDGLLVVASHQSAQAAAQLETTRKDLIHAEEALSILRIRSDRISTLRLRIEMDAHLKGSGSSSPLTGSQILSGKCALISFKGEPIYFDLLAGYVTPTSNSSVLISTSADANENSLVGKDVSALQDFGFISFDVPGFLRIMDPAATFEVKAVRIYTVINGISVPVIDWNQLQDAEYRSRVKSFNAYASLTKMKTRYAQAVDRP